MKILHFGFWVAFFIISLCSLKKVKAEQPWNIGSVSPKKEKTLEGKIFNLSEPNKFFTGRAQEIEKAASVLLKKKETVLVIEGVSGIGKTQLAKKYAYSFLDKYDLIWWFNAEKNMETQVDELLKEIYQRERKPYYRPANLLNLIRKLNYELDSLKSNWLIIFDNVDEIKSINEYVPFKGTDLFLKHVIVTSKKMNRTFSSLTMQKFQRKESLTFLSKILEEEKEEELNVLAETLEDFPLALAQAASYIKMNPSINVKTYLQLFKESLSELWKAEEKLIEGKKVNQTLSDSYNKTIYTAIKININSIKACSPLAYEMLCFCSLLNHQHIPFDVFEHWACHTHGATKIEFHEALSILLNYFLLEEAKSLKDKKNSKLFNQHELIQLITLETINNDSKKFILKEASECILQELTYSPETLFEQFKGKEHFYNHMEKLYHLAEKLNFNDGSILDLKIALLYYIHFIQHDFARATALIYPIKNQVGKADNISPLAKVWFYCIIINDRMFEDWSEVEKSYKKVLECLELIKDKETKNSYLLHATIDYAESLSNFGRIKEAIAVCDNLEETLKITENKSEKIAFLSSSALVRIKYGQYEQALKEIERCLKLISKQDGTENYTPFLMVKKANCLLYQRKEKEAFQIIEEYYPHLLEVYESPECIVLVRAQLIKGACLSALGNLDEAINVIEKSLYPYEKTSGFGNDALKGMGYRILGEIFEAKGEFLKAFDEYTKAEKLYNQILQEKTLDDLSLLYMRLAILGTKVRDDMMVKKYLSLHIDNYGLSHPRTFEIKKYLDSQNLSLP